MTNLKKIISGGQTGADHAGLVVGKRFGLETGGRMPKGFKTLSGNRSDFKLIYNMEEDTSPAYPPRTKWNVENSDATIRIAGDFNSPGEKLTLKYIKAAGKLDFKVDITDPPPHKELVEWLVSNRFETINVAGNSEQTFKGMHEKAVDYLTHTLLLLGLKIRITKYQIASLLRLFDVTDYQDLRLAIESDAVTIRLPTTSYDLNFSPK